MRCGRGAAITAGPGARPGRARLTEALHRLIAQARELGLTDQEFLSLVHNGLAGAPVTAPQEH